MKPRLHPSVAIGALFIISGVLSTSAAYSEKALWIEFKEDGKHTTTIAITEGIARELLDPRHHDIRLTRRDRKELLTREMLIAVLDGAKDVVEVYDDQGMTSARAYLDDLRSPATGSGNDRLIVETYKSGNRTLRITLPDVEVEEGGNDEEEVVKTSFGWKGLLPFLARMGGAVYIDNRKENTEVWIYVD